MKIAWFHSHLLFTNSGGTRFVLDYAAGLISLGHQVTLYCDIASPATRERLRSTGVELVELDTVSTNSPFYYLTLPWRLAAKRKRLAPALDTVDVLVASMFPMNWLIAPFAAKRRVQMCYEPFAFFYEKGFLRNFRFYHRWFFRLMKALYAASDIRSVRAMDCVLTVNRTNLPRMREIYGVEPGVVYAGIDTRVYYRRSPAEIAEIRRRHPGEVLLFHSTDLTGIKGTMPLLEVIAELAKELPGLKLLITVYVDLPDGINLLKTRIVELGLEKNVEYLGCLPREALPEYYSAVDFVCQPSINQPANWPLKEALLCGTPIIGGMASEEVEDGVNGIRVDINDRDDAVAKLREIIARRGQLHFDMTGLAAEYSFEGCLSTFAACCAGQTSS